MILEAVRIVADGLKDSVYGVNVILDALERDEHDAPPPPVEAIVDVTRDAFITAGESGVDYEFPPDWPALIVSPFGAFTTEGEASPNQGKLDGTGAGIQVVYATGKADLSEAMQDGAYTMRAVSQSLTQLFLSTNSARRTRNGVHLWSIRRRQWGPILERRGPGYLTADFVAEFHTRDLSP